MSMENNHRRVAAGDRLRESLASTGLVSFIGVYDVFSATLAARHFDSLFVSGFGFAASHYGLPDVGFITWTDIVAFVQRLRTVLPKHNLLVDIDDGYCDPEVACHVVSVLQAAGASAVVLEDQKRPRRCGHFEGKQIMELDEYLAKLKAVLAVRRDMLVIARTDSSDLDDIERRVSAFADAGADAVLVDGLKSLDTVRELSKRIDRPFCFNQIAGGKSPACTQSELRDAGVSLIIYSTPCLFAAQAAIDDAMATLKAQDGTLAGSPIGVSECTRVLNENLLRRDSRSR
ncbi:MAG: isocitrate lyase/PEP mutase family protein [Candidatus Accumulibacter meliphilus]|jgi:2-methylisocitrate lyase-like PEP mutase family enzyme|uniref:isocitrate lyase/PEP mutase family protein n=1 Tax=Candidatus Accumulibacter meliphilus TaxID=2211374 RepID=UPI002FC30ED8